MQHTKLNTKKRKQRCSCSATEAYYFGHSTYCIRIHEQAQHKNRKFVKKTKKKQFCSIIFPSDLFGSEAQ